VVGNNHMAINISKTKLLYVNIKTNTSSVIKHT